MQLALLRMKPTRLGSYRKSSTSQRSYNKLSDSLTRLQAMRVPSLLLLLLLLATAIHVVFYIHISRMEEIRHAKNEVNVKRVIQELIPQNSDERCGHKVLTPHFLESKNINRYTNTKIEDYNLKPRYKVFVNRKEKTFDRRKLYPSCSFTPLDDSGPVPVLFLINGRSGSSNTWLTLSKLAGGKPRGAKEAFGSDSDQIRSFFKSMKSEEEGSWWLREHLCEVTKLHCNSAISGIQWKPYANTWSLPSAKGVLKEIARHNAEAKLGGKNPQIRVLYMTRNPIDVEISRVKHRAQHTYAHCINGDEECLKQHKNMKNLTLPTNDLVSKLKEDDDQVRLIVSTLETMGVEYYRTSYEKLYNSNNAEEWMNIFRYLGRGPIEGLTLDKVNESFHLAKTTDTSRQDLLSNYDEVRKVLANSDFVHLLED